MPTTTNPPTYVGLRALAFGGYAVTLVRVNVRETPCTVYARLERAERAAARLAARHGVNVTRRGL